MTGPELVCPTCPVCGSLPSEVSAFTAPGQMWCETDGCRVLMWNGTLPDGGLADMRVVDLERRDDADRG